MSKSKRDLLYKFLISLYSHGNAIAGIFLEGGAALSLIYKITEEFSCDLDFTIDDASRKNNFLDCIRKTTQYVLGNNIQVKNLTEKIILKKNSSEIFHIDFCVAQPKNCEYNQVISTLDNLQSTIFLHSLNDILAEKLCCIIDPNRKKIKDIRDALHILQTNQINFKISNNLFKKKTFTKWKNTVTIRQINYSDIASQYVSGHYTFAAVKSLIEYLKLANID